ncbi:biosynthetic peptidoglycan transglycosylase [[Clostridium] dakarense]|uniref:biosynthetic peptidoglycan transglycosylase n=1 Tax=Faecalimicrobium dakarense TaxID=1301100 RepID=UPI0004B77257|nr:biosynthetic peptidoglycan transglycosylase [[Clostridium] dakarense]
MSYYDKNENKIRRRKVSSSDNITRNLQDNRSYEKNSKANNSSIKKDRIDRERTYSSSRVSKSKRNKKKAKKRKILKKMLVIMLIPLVILSLAGSAFVMSSLKGAQPVTKELLESKYISSQVVSTDEIPKHLKNAIVSIEDERFYDHKGVDVISLVRSVLHNILTDTTQGGSTIEMQISKNLITNDDKTLKRKLRDMYNAISMDKNMTKDEILGVYLNNIYLGKSSYGVGKGAQVYFGKNVSELTLAECAMIAGITNNPARYVEHREAKKRQETILYKMNELGYITDEEYKDALRESVPFISEIGK